MKSSQHNLVSYNTTSSLIIDTVRCFFQLAGIHRIRKRHPERKRPTPRNPSKIFSTQSHKLKHNILIRKCRTCKSDAAISCTSSRSKKKTPLQRLRLAIFKIQQLNAPDLQLRSSVKFLGFESEAPDRPKLHNYDYELP